MLKKLRSLGRRLAPAAVRLALVGVVCASALTARSQIIYGGIQQTGLVAAPILTGFAVTSNQVNIPVIQHYLMITNAITNFNYVISYGSLLVGQSGSNFITQVTLTTNLNAANGFTNGCTWIYTVPAQYLTPYATPWGSVLLQPTNGTGVGVPFVSFQ